MEEEVNYNDEPVHYCKTCLSLRVKTVAMNIDLNYCDHCGSTDIETAHINEWQELFRERYGYDYLDKNVTSNGRKRFS